MEIFVIAKVMGRLCTAVEYHSEIRQLFPQMFVELYYFVRMGARQCTAGKEDRITAFGKGIAGKPF
jgi:hypothetical protein